MDNERSLGANLFEEPDLQMNRVTMEAWEDDPQDDSAPSRLDRNGALAKMNRELETELEDDPSGPCFSEDNK